MNRNAVDQTLDATLRELIMKARRGDTAAYKRMLSEATPVIRRAVAARIGRGQYQSAVEDITQDTLLAVHLKLHTYDDSQAFLPWLRTVARYKMIDFLRRNHHGVTVSIDDETVAEPEDETSNQDRTASRDLNKLLGLLKPPAGDIIRALKVEGASVRDLAATYKVSEANIKVIVHRGLQKLAQQIRSERGIMS